LGPRRRARQRAVSRRCQERPGRRVRGPLCRAHTARTNGAAGGL